MVQITEIVVEREYEKNEGNLRREDVQTLQDWLGKQPHLPQITELEIILFLHSCYYSVEATKVTIDAFYTFRTHCSEFYTNRDSKDKNLQKAMNVLLLSALPESTPEGYKVFICKLMMYDPNDFEFSDVLKYFCMFVDLWLHEEGTAQGHVLIIDMDNVVFSHLTKFSILLLKHFFYYVQEALPFRLKQLHYINTASLMDKLMALIKPFIKNELLNKTHFHKKTDENFFKFVPQRCLPCDMGGNADSCKILQERAIKKIIDNYQWFIDDEQRGRVDENRRPGEAKNASDLFGVNGSFKKLDID